jgi:hypothetical protein
MNSAQTLKGRAEGMNATNHIAHELVSEFEKVPTINSHSHVIPESDRLERDLDALSYFAHPYCASDLLSAGMNLDTLRFVTGDQGDLTVPVEARPNATLAERWEQFEPWWHRVKHTGFCQCLVEGWRAVYGIDSLNSSTVGPISEAIRDGRRPGHYAEVLKGAGNIQVSFVQMGGPFGEPVGSFNRELFVPVPRLNRLTMLRSAGDVSDLENEYGRELATVDALSETMAERCAAWKAMGVPEVKLSQSYHRAMDFGEPDHATAARVYEGLRRGRYDGLDSANGKALEDVLVFHAVRAATSAGLPVQFHVGPRAGMFGSLEGTSLAPMALLIRSHPNARFDISHSGFPYLTEAAVLAKTCTNVFLNLSWLHIYSPEGCVRALREWLRMVPMNKVIGFGDDLYWVDSIVGHLQMARQNVAEALAGMINDRILNHNEAITIGRALFHDNPASLYGLR